MPRSNPHSGVCDLCRRPIIDARVRGEGTVRLDAHPHALGAYRAFLDGNTLGWIATHAGDSMDGFMGTRRCVHICPDVQLSL